MADDKNSTPSSQAPRSWLRSWGSSSRKVSGNVGEQQQAATQTPPPKVDTPILALKTSSEIAAVRESETHSPQVLNAHKENEALVADLSKLVQSKDTQAVLETLSSLQFPDSSIKADPRLCAAVLEALDFLSSAGREISSSPQWKLSLTHVKEFFGRSGEQASAQFGSVFMRGLDCNGLVKLLRCRSEEIRGISLHLFSKLYVDSLDRPWTMSHREKRLAMMGCLVEHVNAESAPTEKAHVELYQALQLFLTSSLLNSVADAITDPALDMFEAERGYDAMMMTIENNPDMSEPLLDCLRCLTFLGGVPKDYEEAYHLSQAENSDEPIQEARNPASFAAVARLVSKMLSASPNEEPYQAIRLPLLHCVMGVYSANPKNFGILERQFQILSQLSRKVGDPGQHDELLFMTVKLFELVALGLEYRPVTAVTVLCDVSLPALAKRGDARTFNVLANTMVKLVQRHSSLALDCGLLKNLIIPQIAAAAKSSGSLPENEESVLSDSLLMLTSCLERHSSASTSTKAIVFKNNCAAARTAGIGPQCKNIITERIKKETGNDVSSPVVMMAVTVMSLLARDEPDSDLTYILELIQHPLMNQSLVALRFRTRLFQHAKLALEANKEAWGGTAAFDCVLTVLLSLEGVFGEKAGSQDGEGAFQLLTSALGFMNQAVRQARDKRHIDFEALFSVIRLTGILQNESTAVEFVTFILKEMVISPSGMSIMDVDPLVLLGSLMPNMLHEKAKLLLFERLSELVANDGEFSCWNRQQLSRFRLAERIVESFSDTLITLSAPLHSSLTRIVSCVGNQCASPELLDRLLRLAYRVAPGDADGKFELVKPTSSTSSLDGMASDPSISPPMGMNGDNQPSQLECVLRMLQLVAEPKIIGRHALLGNYMDDEYATKGIDIPVVFKRHWPPGTAASVANGGINSPSYAFSCWVWLAIGHSAPSVPLVTLSSNAMQLLTIGLEMQNENGETDVGLAGMGMDCRRVIVIKTANATCAFDQTPELYAGRWHHLVIVHRKAEQRNLVATFWAGNQDAKGGAGKADLYINGAFVQSTSLVWPHAVESTSWMRARIGSAPNPNAPAHEISRWRLGPTALFEGALTDDLIAGLFMRGPNYRGALTKISPMFQDKRAILASAFERMHLLARDDDFVNRIGGESTSPSAGWKNVQKFALNSMNARLDTRSTSVLLRFDPDFHGEPLLREIVPLPMQESLASVGGATCAFLPLFLRVGASATFGLQGDLVHFHNTNVVSLVLSLMRDSLRSSDSARFAFRLDDGHRVLAWLLHLVSQARDRSDIDTFRIALTFSTIGTGFDATIIDPEALFYIAMNDHVWRRHDSSRVSWDLVAELLPWLTKLVHQSNRHRIFNYAALQPLNVFEWVLSTMILLVAESQPSTVQQRDGKDGFDLLWLASVLLETLLRCDPDAVSIVFQYVLVTLSNVSSTLSSDEEETILHLLVRANKLLSSLADHDDQVVQLQTYASSGSDFHLNSPVAASEVSGAGGVTLDDLRCALLDVLIRFRKPLARAAKEDALAHSAKISALYEQYGNGDWLGCIMEYASEDFETVRRVLAFCEIEFRENGEFAKLFLQSKSFQILSDALHGGKFANAPDILLFWARLVSGVKPQAEQTNYTERKLTPRSPLRTLRTISPSLSEASAAAASSTTAAAAADEPTAFQPPTNRLALRSQLESLASTPGFGSVSTDAAFATAAYESLHTLIRENALRNDEEEVNEDLIRFLWLCAKNSSALGRLWTNQACIKALVKTVFVQETFQSFGKKEEETSDKGKTPSSSGVTTSCSDGEEDQFPVPTAMNFLIDLIGWAFDPAEAFRIAANSFPDEASVERVATYQTRLFLGLLPHAMINPFLANVLIQRSCVGWTPGLELQTINLALESKGVHPSLVRSAILCAVDRNFGTSEDERVLEYLLPNLPHLLTGLDMDLFVACLVRCIFPFALEQATSFATSTAVTTSSESTAPSKESSAVDEEGQAVAKDDDVGGEEDTDGEEEWTTTSSFRQPTSEDLRRFVSWRFFHALCSLAPESIKKLLVTEDAALMPHCARAGTALTKELRPSWLIEFGPSVRQIINQHSYFIWSREMERQAGRWYVAGRIPVSLGAHHEGSIHMLMEMTRSSNSEKANVASGAPRIRGWTTPRDRSDTFLTTGQARLERVLKARHQAFQKQEQLFFAKFEDLLRGKKSWSTILRRAQLPSMPWEPYRGRHLDLEAQHQRWKLDPFEDPSRARRRLRQNRTFYKRYNLVRVQPHPLLLRRDTTGGTIGGSQGAAADLSTVFDEPASALLPKMSNPWPGKGKRRASSVGSSPHNLTPRAKMSNSPARSPTSAASPSLEIDPTTGSPVSVIRALRKPQPFERVRTHTLVTNESGEEEHGDDLEQEQHTGDEGDDEEHEEDLSEGENDEEEDEDDDASCSSSSEGSAEDGNVGGRKLPRSSRGRGSLDGEDAHTSSEEEEDKVKNKTPLDRVVKETIKPKLFDSPLAPQIPTEALTRAKEKGFPSPRLRSAESSASDSNRLDDEMTIYDSPIRKMTSRNDEFGSAYDDYDVPGVSSKGLGPDEDEDDDKDYVVVDIRVRAHRERVRAEMDPQDRDNVSFKINCSTVRGLEERKGLCLVARTSVYVVDNYEVAPDGTIIEVDERNQDFHVQVRQEDESVLVGDDNNTNTSLLLPPLTTTASESVARGLLALPPLLPKRKKSLKSVSHRKRCVRYDDVVDVYRRRFLFRDVGLEIFCSDGSTLLIVLQNKQERDRLQTEFKKARKKALLSVDLPFAKSSSSSDSSVIASMSLDTARKRWVNGQISNFDYLTLLNTLAGRSYNDPAQYLVFPWVLADYESQELDLENPKSFRNLSKPMGALTDERIAYVTERYASLEASAESTGIPPFHFGTHYSCSGYVANFLFRLEPFSRMALQLQGGAFDRADRLFRSVEATWKSASGLNLNMQDVRELVPEFYCMHEFLENRNRFELGVTQRGAAVGDVELPPWAKGSASEFIRLHRKALESKYVSEHLNEWIDLVFGYKQRGREAIKAINVFHPLTYEGEVDLDSITDPAEREATMEQIHSFGQTPTKLFENQPHPKREIQPPENWAWHSPLAPPLVVPGSFDRPINASNRVGLVSLDCLESGSLPELRPGEVSIACLEDLPGLQETGPDVSFINNNAPNARIVDLILDEADRVFALKAAPDYNATFVGNNPARYVAFGESDGSLDIHATSSGGPLSSEIVDRILVSFEHLHRNSILHLCVVDDGKFFVTGGEDGVVRVWRVRRSKDLWRLEREGANVGHRAGSPVTSLTVSKSQGLIVSGGDDGAVNVWDLGRRQEYIRTLRGHKKPIRFLGVNSANSNIMSVCEKEARIWHVNGDLIASAEFKSFDLTQPSSAIITPCMGYQPGVVMVVGHVSGDISLWDFLHPADKSNKSRKENERVLLQVRAVLKHGISPVISLTLSKDKRMFVSGDQAGEVKRWASAELLHRRFKHLALPQGGITSLPGTLLATAIAGRGAAASSSGSTTLLRSTLSSEKDLNKGSTTTAGSEPNF